MTADDYPPRAKVLGIGSVAGHSLAHVRSTSIAVRWRFSPGPDGARQNRRLSLGNQACRAEKPCQFLGGCINQTMYPND